jgi:hypothetical protein
MINNLSPEEILRAKETESGIEFEDIPKSDDQNYKEIPNIPVPESNSINIDSEKAGDIPSLGKSQGFEKSSRNIETGWKNLPVNLLPSAGRYYPDGAEIAIRPAEVFEIKHFSTVEEEDISSVSEALNFILSRCMKMNFPSEGVVDYRDIIQEDRFFMVMAIRDITFINGENRIILKPKIKCKETRMCPYNGGFELKTGALDFFSISDKVMHYYSTEERCFSFTLRTEPEDPIKLSIPTIGVTDIIYNFIEKNRNKLKDADKSFLKIAPFIFQEWRDLNDDLIFNEIRKSDYWSKERFSLFYKMSTELKTGTKLNAKIECPECKGNIEAPIVFEDGIKSIFVISDIFGQLL